MGLTELLPERLSLRPSRDWQLLDRAMVCVCLHTVGAGGQKGNADKRNLSIFLKASFVSLWSVEAIYGNFIF